MKKPPQQKLTAPIRRVRFVWVAFFFCLWVAAIVTKLGWLQVVRHQDFAERATRQQQRTFEVAPRRGVLYDRNLRELAMTVSVESIYAVPSEIKDNKAEVAAQLAKIIHADANDRFTSEEKILDRINGQRNFAWIVRKPSADVLQRVKELNLKGIYFQDEFKRFYPNGDLAAHMLGYVGTDDNGLGGLERRFERDLHGQPGERLTAVDAKRHVLGSEETEPQPGTNLVLSIDANIQYMAERALDAQMQKVKAAHGTIVVQDPHTGQILALAVSPRFNPNDSRHMDADLLNNLAVSDVYEPGSTFKLVTYAAALDAAGVEPTDIVDCQGGALTMYGRTLHDDKSDGHLGRVTVLQALEKSSDVGAAKMALKVGPDRFYQYIKGFGFGDRSGIELPSETRGLLRQPRKWDSTSILSIAIGQEVGVTPVQLVSMVSAIANGGVYMPPRLILQSTPQHKGDGHLIAAAFRPANQLPSTLPSGAHRVITELTSAKMRAMMQGIVVEGTGRPAQLNGYSAGGKTGTAQKIDPATHTYSHTKLVASFAGFAPVSSPAISVAVVIDTPTVGSLYGTAVSAPVFHDLAQQVLEYLGLPHDQPVKTSAQLQLAAKSTAPDDVPNQPVANLAALFDQVNSLPADDPLRQSAVSSTDMGAPSVPPYGTGGSDAASPGPNAVPTSLSAQALAAFHAHGDTTSVMPDSGTQIAQAAPARPVVATPHNGVVLDSSRRIAVPHFQGAALRRVVEDASRAGLRVQTLGSGLAREQMPAPGTLVPAGTEVIVRFAR